jgi:hypothetical protein
MTKQPGYETLEATTKTFRDCADELLNDDGKPKPGVNEDDLAVLGFLSGIVREHLLLGNLTIDAAVNKFGSPLAVHAVRQDNIFRIALNYIKPCEDRVSLEWTEETDGRIIWHDNSGTLPMQCFEYRNLYLWAVNGVIWAASPRSPRFDRYIESFTLDSISQFTPKNNVPR